MEPLHQVRLYETDTRLYRSGKSSISNVVFRKMAPQDTLFLETTTTILKESMQ